LDIRIKASKHVVPYLCWVQALTDFGKKDSLDCSWEELCKLWDRAEEYAVMARLSGNDHPNPIGFSNSLVVTLQGDRSIAIGFNESNYEKSPN
jgi:hypothetical protein